MDKSKEKLELVQSVMDEVAEELASLETSLVVLEDTANEVWGNLTVEQKKEYYTSLIDDVLFDVDSHMKILLDELMGLEKSLEN